MNPIGVFDSGLGGLTVLSSLRKQLTDYDFIYLGDNARAPYGPRSFDTIYRYTKSAVQFLFEQGCPLVILACNTASARALRTLQQQWLPLHYPNRRILGVIRPMTEFIHEKTMGDIGILATPGTVRSSSYIIELEHFFGKTRKVHQVSCPLLVPLIENKEVENPGFDFFLDQYLKSLFLQNPNIKQLILGCTHYPLIKESIKNKISTDVQILEHGPIVADKLKDYLRRHWEINSQLTKQSKVKLLTTEDPKHISETASLLLNKKLNFEQIDLSQFDF